MQYPSALGREVWLGEEWVSGEVDGLKLFCVISTHGSEKPFSISAKQGYWHTSSSCHLSEKDLYSCSIKTEPSMGLNQRPYFSVLLTRRRIWWRLGETSVLLCRARRQRSSHAFKRWRLLWITLWSFWLLLTCTLWRRTFKPRKVRVPLSRARWCSWETRGGSSVFIALLWRF